MASNRALLLCTVVGVGFLVVVLRLADLMLLNHARLAEKARMQQYSSKEVTVHRGIIYDRRGRELAVNVDAVSVGCRAEELEDPSRAAAILSEALGRPKAEILREINKRSRFFWLARKAELGRDSIEKLAAIKGIEVFNEPKRYYPKGTLGSHVIGIVGVDNQPLEGVELKYDSKLGGEELNVVVSRDVTGLTLSSGMDVEEGGNNVILSLDEGLQYIVEKELAKGLREASASYGLAVVMDPYTGDILAMANHPDYDLNRPGEFGMNARRNRSITDPYEPGSTFKLVTATAVLEEKVAGLGTKVDVSDGYISVAGKRIYDTTKKGVISFEEVIKTSSNVGTIKIAQRLKRDSLYKYVKAFGFGQKSGIDLPGEASGMVRPPSQWSETSQAAVSIGYEVAVTPIQVLRAYAAVANGGYLVRPHVVNEIVSPEGNVIYRFDKTQVERVMDASTALGLRRALVSVTEEGGTAMTASVDGNLVAGKTGTTRLLDPATGKYSTKKYASSFVGFVPADKPALAMIVVIFEPKGKHYYGGYVAAPVFKSIADQALSYMNVPREDTIKNNMLLVHSAQRF